MSYQPLNNVTTADAYTDANTMYCPGAVRVNIDNNNAAIYYQLGDGIGGVSWRPEVYLVPKFISLDRRADAVRVRSAKAATPAQVTVDAIPAAEIPGGPPPGFPPAVLGR